MVQGNVLGLFLRFPPLRIFLNLTFEPFPPNFLQTATLGTVMGASLVQPEKLEEEEDPILCCPVRTLVGGLWELKLNLRVNHIFEDTYQCPQLV